jgi:hypothetical protein
VTLVQAIRIFNRVMLVVAFLGGIGWAVLDNPFARPCGVISVVAALLSGIGAEVLERLRAAPRRFTTRQREAFNAAARAIPKSPLGVAVSAADQEATAFSTQVVNLLSQAGWDVRHTGGVAPPIASGLAVGVSQPDAEAEAQQLVNAFNAAGIAASKVATPVVRPFHERLTVLIGPKPAQ